LRTWANLPQDTAIILHQGQMRDDRGCSYLVQAMQHVTGAALIFLGDGPLKPALVQLTRELDLSEKVHFHPPVPPDQLLSLTAGATLGVTLLEDTCLNHRLALPNKLFEYLMAGLPVLGSNLPEIRSVVEAKNVGLVVDPADPEALADTLQRMVDDHEARNNWSANTQTVFETFSWEQASQVFTQTYRTLLSPQKDS
jgi:glycosyltransferase involved in cell wall biosynthesis